MNSNTLKTLWRIISGFLLVVSMASTNGSLPAHAAGVVTRVSVDTNEMQANAISYVGDISADGRFVAFDSEATNLVPNDTNGVGDVFLRDLHLGTTVPVSVTVTGEQTNGGGGAPSISADGRFVAFETGSTNFIPGDTNGFGDIYLKDMLTGAVTRVSVPSTGGEPNNESMTASISGDGRYVVFDSDADNLVPNDTNGAGDIFVRDLQLGTTTGVTIPGNFGGFDGSISLDGHFVVFSSRSSNLVPDDTNDAMDIFVYSIQTGQIVRASVNSNSLQGDHASIEPSISGDGRYVTFSTASNDFTTIETYGYSHLYVRDMQAGITTLASYQNGYAMIGESDSSEISANGRYIIFSFDDKGDGMPDRWLYIHDRVANTTTMAVSRTSDYFGSAALPTISADGTLFTFISSASSFVPDDTNGVRDVFVKTMSYSPDLNPTVVSIQHGCPNGCSTSADQFIDFLVKFSEPVTGVDAADFALTIGGNISGAAVSTVSGVGSDYVVHIDTGTGDGTLRLDVVDDDSIKDYPQNPLGGAGVGNGNFTSGEVYTVDKSLVAVTSILRLDPSPSTSSIIHFAVNFSEPVTGVDASDFVLTLTDSISGATVTEVAGGGTAYTVTVNSGVGDGTLRLDLIDDDSIHDAFSIPLGGLGTSTGYFTSGEVYTLDHTPPSVVTILRADPNPTAAGVVHFIVSFSEPVSGVDASDFALTTSGISDAALTEVLVSGNNHLITVNTGTGNGTIRLDLLDNDSILDLYNLPLGGVDGGNFNGETYTVTKFNAVLVTERLRSTGANDGWIRESRQGTGVGGTRNVTNDTFILGDDQLNRQYRSILHFPTYYLPDNAVVTKAILTFKYQGVNGTDPFAALGNISIDIRHGSFGTFGPFSIRALQSSDFQAAASLNNAGVIQNSPVGGWYWTMLDASSFPYINLAGITQIRLAFQTATDADSRNDQLLIYSGDHVEQSYRPHLMIEYYVP